MDISQVPELAKREGWALAIDSYDAVPQVRQRLGEVMPVTDEFILGEKGSSYVGLGRPRRIRHGQEIPSDDGAPGWTWYIKTHKLAHRLDLSFEDVRAIEAGRAATMIADNARIAGENHANEKEDMVADMLQQGTLTAGNLDVFDGSFTGETDPYPKFIYDGVPWFDTAHPRAVGSTTYSNHDVSNALTLANLEAADAKMRVTNAYNERGERITIRPTGLIVPAGTMGFTAMTLLESLLKPGSANNDANNMRGKYELIEWAALDDAASASAWWLFELGKGLRMRDSGAPVQTVFIDDKKEIVSIKWVSYFGAGVTNWRHHYCGNKAAS